MPTPLPSWCCKCFGVKHFIYLLEKSIHHAHKVHAASPFILNNSSVQVSLNPATRALFHVWPESFSQSGVQKAVSRGIRRY
jgi:hypothetical protein